MHQFSQIYIEITNVCNLTCAFCPKTQRPAQTMSLPDFQIIIDQVKPLTKRVMFHVMGEPLLHSQFPEFVKIASAAGLEVVITTNGTLFDQPNAQLLFNAGVHQVNISMHAIQGDIGSDEATAQLKQIFDFTHKAFQDAPDLYLNYRFWNLNSGNEIDDQKNNWLCDEVEKEFELKVPRHLAASGRKSKRLINRLYLNEDTRFVWPGHNSGFDRTKGTCHALGRQIAILVDGTVVPCCLDSEGTINLGNCLKTPLESILESKRAKVIKAGFNRGKLIEPLCQNCNFCQRFTVKSNQTNR